MDTIDGQCYSPAMPTPALRLTLAATVLLVALGLRAAAAWWLPLGADEAQSVAEFWWPSLWLEQERLMNPPLWRVAVMAMLGLTDDLVTLRLLSALLAALGCATLTWSLARVRLGTLAAGMAGFGLAITPWAVRSQAQVRAYGLTLLAAVAIVLALRHLLRRPDRRAHILAALAVGVGGWVHYALLPWVGPWLLLLVVATRRAGASASHGDSARQMRLHALVWVAGPGLLVGAVLLALPVQWASGGWLLKSGGASASMPAWAGLDLLWRPEALLAVAALVGAWRGRHKYAAEATVAVAALAIAGLIIVASTWTRTLRWTHLVVAAPGLWLGVAVLLETLPRGARRAGVALLAAALVLSALSLVGHTARHHGRGDDVALAAWRARLKPPHLASWTLLEGEQAQPVGRGLLHAAGGFANTEQRCVGADRVHLRRCRARVQTLSQTDCQALCDTVGCIWQLDGLPEALHRETGPKTACGPGVLAAQLPVALAALVPDPEARRRLTVASLVDRLHLPPASTSTWRLVAVDRWRVLVPEGAQPRPGR